MGEIMSKTVLSGLNIAEIEKLLEPLKASKFRAKQIQNWIYLKSVTSIDEMTETEGAYTILASTENSPVYISNEDGKFTTLNSPISTNIYLGQFNGYYTYAIEQ